MCTRHANASVENEEGHALHPHGARLLVRFADLSDDLVIAQRLLRLRRVKPGALGQSHQHRGLGQVLPLNEISIKQGLDHGLLLRSWLGQGNQAVGRPGIGLAGNFVKRKRNVQTRAHRFHAVVDRAGPRAKLRLHIVCTQHAFGRHVRVELKRVPANDRLGTLRVLLGIERQSAFDAAFADVAPGANHVGNDVNGEGCVHGFSEVALRDAERHWVDSVKMWLSLLNTPRTEKESPWPAS